MSFLLASKSRPFGASKRAFWAGLVAATGLLLITTVGEAKASGCSTLDAYALCGTAVDEAPAVTITSGPPEYTNETKATFEFEAEGNVDFTCKLDDGEEESCRSPKTYQNLSEGQAKHTFAVYATNTRGETGPASTYSWTIDTVDPETSIDPSTMHTVTDPDVIYRYSTPSEPATFLCKLDDGEYEDCTDAEQGCNGCTMSVQEYKDLAAGEHRFSVKAVDAAGNVDKSAATDVWVVDDNPPSTEITSGPASSTVSTVARFSFQSDEAGGSFKCVLDGAQAEDCRSPKVYSSLAVGEHTFKVYAFDRATNKDEVGATWKWTVTGVPDTLLLAVPTNPSNDATPTFEFLSTLAGSSYECKLDSSAFTSCTNPLTYAQGLNNGPHVFSVRAIYSGVKDPSPATYKWSIDTKGPETWLTSRPTNTTTSTSATFGFLSVEADVVYECSIDSAPITTCTSPTTYNDLSLGAHSFTVRGADSLGNKGGEVTWGWTVVKNLPDARSKSNAKPKKRMKHATKRRKKGSKRAKRRA